MKDRIMFIGAHQDDMEGSTAGLFAKLSKEIIFEGLELTLTDGTSGHFKNCYYNNPALLRNRRVQEATAAANLLGFDYKLLQDNNGNFFKDGQLEVDLDTKGAVWKTIRDFNPSLLITLPVNNIQDSFGMHNDHTNVGEIVKRVSYLISVPFAFPEYQNRQMNDGSAQYIEAPVIVTVHDNYSGQINPDLIIDISEVIDVKIEAWCKHISQWKEWLPWVGNYKPPEDKDEIKQGMIERSHRLSQYMGIKPGVYEAFTITNWGKKPTLETIKRFFPGDIYDYELAEKKISKFL